MPELPEVHALAHDLDQRLRGRPITRIDLASFQALKTFDPPLFALHGTLVESVTRHGKFLDIDASGVHLVIHLARAGWIRWREELPALPPKPGGKSPLAARVVLDEDEAGHTNGLDITEAGTKKSLAIYVTHDPMTLDNIARLGPDPLADDFTVDLLAEILHDAGRAQIKGVLRHQGTIAGIGNAYSDEILHAARMSPFKPASSLADAEVETLYAALRTTLTDAVERSTGLAASELKGEKKSHMAVHGRTGEKCPVCGDVVREVSFAGSSLQYCATCQTGGKPLADRRTSKFLK
ncbi:Fpg/Nei family DNA glycosylase [Nocardioides sp. Y6]|uniref:Fpg/Nei family DNA glycosylase n=1 Tax=Nocardioides malaquae TaxID=2773426 RepID=A0ABR9RSK4_9ACTN|nr:Fpg/Nei family DNA glycosylase [Nocardioides malaquae]MBE7324562.1 Fpg/Nei family DNA glycosylase [Nocardioides malaquae]